MLVIFKNWLKHNIQRALKKERLPKYQTEDDSITCRIRDVDNEIFCLGFRISQEMKLCTLYTIIGNNIPEEKRSKIAEYLTYANYGMALGNFEMDFSDGEVRFKVTLVYGEGTCWFFGAVPTVGDLRRAISISLSTVKRYNKGISEISNNEDLSAKEACDDVEKRRVTPHEK